MAAVTLGSPNTVVPSYSGSIIVPSSVSQILASPGNVTGGGSINIPNAIPIGGGQLSTSAYNALSYYTKAEISTAGLSNVHWLNLTNIPAGLVEHMSRVDNPHVVTKTQVGLGNVANESKLTMFTNPTFTGVLTTPVIKITTGAGINRVLVSSADGTASWGVIGSGVGDVFGPATNNDGYIPLWDGVNTKVLKNGIPTSTFLTTETDPIWLVDREYWYNNESSGRMWGGIITDAGAGKVNIAAGAGLSKTGAADLETVPTSINQGQGSSTQLVSWNAISNFSLAGVGYNLIYWDASAATFAVQLKENFYANFDFTRDFTIGRVYYDGTIVSIRLCGMNRWNFDRRVQMFGEERFPVERTTGLMISATGTRNIAITAGVLWAELVNRFSINAFDSSGADRFTYWYRGAITGTWISVAAQSQIDNLNYDNNTGTLVELTANRYGVYWVYIDHMSNVHVIYGQGDYTLAQSSSAGTPAILPGLVAAYSTLVGKIVIQKSAATFTSIQTPFTTTFQVGGVSDHNDLGGLQGGAVGDYWHLTNPGATVDREILTWNGIAGDAVRVSTGASISSLGHMTVGGDVIAYQYGSPSGSYWDDMPVATNSTKGGFILWDDQFTMTAGVLKIKDNILAPAVHTHSWADITTGTQPAPVAHNLIDTTNHPVSGLSTGHFLKATSATTYGFAAHGLIYSDVGAIGKAVDSPDRGIPTWNGTTGNLLRNNTGASISSLGHMTVGGDVIAYQYGSPSGSYWDDLPWEDMPYATALAVGGIKIGSGLTITDGVVSVASGGGMVYPGAGIPLSTGSAWGTSIANNSANWNTAHSWGNHAGLYSLLGHGHAETEVSFTDITTGDSSTTKHGYLRKLNGSTVNYLRGDGTWVTPPNTTYTEITEAEITAGTASTLRTITGRRAAYIIGKSTPVAHATNTSNPHSVTATQVSLGNVTNESKATMFTNPVFTGTITGISGNAEGINWKFSSGFGNSSISNVFDSGADANNRMNFNVNTAAGTAITRMSILGNGNVGIGVSPATKLHIDNGTSANTVRLTTTSEDVSITMTTLTQQDWGIGVDFSDSGKFKIDQSTTVGGNTRLTINPNGTIVVGSTITAGELRATGDIIAYYV